MSDAKRLSESYGRLYDDILENRKVAQLQPAEFGLYCALISYSHRNDTDGDVPMARARGLLYFKPAAFQAALSHLFQVGLIDKTEEKVTVHDYALHNETHAERNAKRIAARNAARIRWSNAQGNAETMPRNKEKEKEKANNASSVGSFGPSEPALDLAVAIADVLGVSVLAPLEIQACEEALAVFPYLIPSELVERAKEHQSACLAKGFPIARTVQGLWEAWRSQNDYNADHGRLKPRGQPVGAMTKAFS